MNLGNVDAVVAVPVAFAGDGADAPFARVGPGDAPTARSGGKIDAVRQLQNAFLREASAADGDGVGDGAATRPPGAPTVLVGDGASDAEAADAVTLFVGFGGFVERPAVRAAVAALGPRRAAWATSLADVVPLLDAVAAAAAAATP